MNQPISSRELARRCSTTVEPGDVWADIALNPLAREIIEGVGPESDWTMDEWLWYDDDDRLHEDEFGEWE